MQIGTSLGRVVGITGVIEETETALSLSTGLNPPCVVRLPGMSDSMCHGDESTKFIAVICALRRILERHGER